MSHHPTIRFDLGGAHHVVPHREAGAMTIGYIAVVSSVSRPDPLRSAIDHQAELALRRAARVVR